MWLTYLKLISFSCFLFNKSFSCFFSQTVKIILKWITRCCSCVFVRWLLWWPKTNKRNVRPRNTSARNPTSAFLVHCAGLPTQSSVFPAPSLRIQYVDPSWNSTDFTKPPSSICYPQRTTLPRCLLPVPSPPTGGPSSPPRPTGASRWRWSLTSAGTTWPWR